VNDNSDVEPDVATIAPAEPRKRFGLRKAQHHRHPPHSLLRARRERPRHCRAATRSLGLMFAARITLRHFSVSSA